LSVVSWAQKPVKKNPFLPLALCSAPMGCRARQLCTAWSASSPAPWSRD
jgi:hypothetical protein